ncbi:MAG: hypothetical protein WBE18_02750 [Gammaproteobacteria bacterium]
MKLKTVTIILSALLVIIVLAALFLMNYGITTHPQVAQLPQTVAQQTVPPKPTPQPVVQQRAQPQPKPLQVAAPQPAQPLVTPLPPAQQEAQAKQPKDINNVCSIFTEYPSWYTDTKQSEHKWGVPIHVQMATMYQESKFVANARPPFKDYLWGVIPWHRQSSAVGFCQALNNSWKDFQQQTGNCGSRTNFSAATDFIGWYGDMIHRYFGIPKQNAYAFYLAYHEGPGGYIHHSYLHKIWLIHVAFGVQKRAHTYQNQLLACRDQLEKIQPATAWLVRLPYEL